MPSIIISAPRRNPITRSELVRGTEAMVQTLEAYWGQQRDGEEERALRSAHRAVGELFELLMERQSEL